MVSLILCLKINLLAHTRDENYLKSFLNIIVDIERLYKGISGNFITNSILENLTKSIDFKPKFPGNHVAESFLGNISWLSEIYVTGHIYLYQPTGSRLFFPKLSEATSVKVELGFVGKITGRKQTIFFCNLIIFVNYDAEMFVNDFSRSQK